MRFPTFQSLDCLSDVAVISLLARGLSFNASTTIPSTATLLYTFDIPYPSCHHGETFTDTGPSKQTSINVIDGWGTPTVDKYSQWSSEITKSTLDEKWKTVEFA